jgi:GR25 family glycosyltransferase involved in LPS biosynthesis
MIRLYLISFQLFGLILTNFFFNSDVTMKIETGAQINGGKEMTVTVTLNKGAINGFSRFQMELPAGITATSGNSANADFSFKDQKVRFMWLRMPEDDAVTISFNIQCNERLKGTFDLAGKFSYIEDNERKSVDLAPQSVTIVPSTSVNPTMLVDINEFGKLGIPAGAESYANIACIRQRPVYSESGKDYTVTLLVNKEALKKFAKIEESIPEGYTAINIESNEGIFTFKNNKVKYLWMNLPASSYFTVSYKLIPLKNDKKVIAPKMNGVFSFIVDDKTQLVTILEKDVTLANLTAQSVQDVLKAPVYLDGQQVASVTPTKTAPETKPTKAATTTQIPEKQTTAAVTKTEPQKLPTTATPEKQQTVTPEKQIATITNKPVEPSVKDETAILLDPKAGVYYRVQIAAGHKPVNIKSYFKKYKLDNTVVKEMHNGWIKYSIGAFTQYRDARDYRVHIWNTTTIADAFVAAYNNGQRITVQEALMIANQKWIQ